VSGANGHLFSLKPPPQGMAEGQSLSLLKSIKLGSPKTRKPANTMFAGFLVFKIIQKFLQRNLDSGGTYLP
jgi:hypothetical protein